MKHCFSDTCNAWAKSLQENCEKGGVGVLVYVSQHVRSRRRMDLEDDAMEAT